MAKTLGVLNATEYAAILNYIAFFGTLADFGFYWILVRELAKESQGGGGGQPFFATAGGKNAAGLSAAIAKAEEAVRSKQ